jgi:hypothetical protein
VALTPISVWALKSGEANKISDIISSQIRIVAGIILLSAHRVSEILSSQVIRTQKEKQDK